MNNISNYTNMPSSMNIKQYYVSGKNGNSVVRVSFNPRSSTTSRTVSGSSSNPSILINIGTKNLDTKADVSKAINRAVFNDQSFVADTMVRNASESIVSQAQDAVKAASTDIPNEDVLGLLV